MSIRAKECATYRDTSPHCWRACWSSPRCRGCRPAWVSRESSIQKSPGRRRGGCRVVQFKERLFIRDAMSTYFGEIRQLGYVVDDIDGAMRSEAHTSELQSLMLK